MELQDFSLSQERPLSFLDSASSSSSSNEEARSPPPFLLSAPISPAFPLDAALAFSPSHPGFFLSSPAPSSGSSPTGSSGGSEGGGATGPRPDAFSAQVRVDFLSAGGAALRGDFLSAGGVVVAAAASQRLCLVCGDLASGFHYGVASCEACKAFFKRTVQGNMEYVCPVTNDCEINKRRRKSCQACRYKKCVHAGMMREGVRLDRVRGGRQKYRRRVEPGSVSRGRCAHLSRNKVMSHLLLTDPAPLAAHQDRSTNDSGLSSLLTLSDLLNRELLLLIGWAKHIPGFSALSLVDQMSLLQSGWMEALLVGVAWRSEGAELVFAENLRLDKAQCRAMGLVELYAALTHLAARYRLMNLSPEEVVTLKAMALANSDADPVDCPDSVQRFQDLLHEALQDHACCVRERHRVGRLLLSLPLLRAAAHTCARALRRLRTRLPLHKLLLEMLDAKA